MFHETNIGSGAVSKEEFHEPFFFLINLAVGGNWPGPPNGATQFPAVMQVDYVRVYQDADVGCTDPAADNYNPNATTDDGSCTYASTTATIEFVVDMNGVDQPSAEYDNVVVNGSWNGWNGWGVTLADEDSDGIYTGSLEIEQGTTFEYVVAVTGSADNWSGWGLQWGDGCGNANVFVAAGGVGTVTTSTLTPGCGVVSGCTDATASNYNASASTDNGSCMYNVTLTVDMNCSGLTPTAVAATGPSEGWSCGSYSLTDGDGDGVWEGTFGLPAGTFEYIYCTDGWGQQETPGLIEEMLNGGTCAPVTDYSNWANRLITVGAMTTVDTWGSCSGCVTVDPGCPEDVDNNGFVTVSDVLTVLSEFGCSAGCQYDLNMDGIVGVSDILEILAAFGNEC
jgi:hypothetical protein